MTKLALVLATIAVFVPGSAIAVQADPAPAAPPAPPVPPAASAPAAHVDLSNDPRMLAAIRHANARADQKCGGAGGGAVDLQTAMTAKACRRHMVEAAKLDAEFDINGH